MKSLFSFAIATIVGVVSAFANDGVYYTSGNQLVPYAETTIQVKKEILTISLLDSKVAKVDVYYEFLNPSSSSKTIQMGFEADPSYNDDYEFYTNGVHKRIYDFTVEMNGQKINHKNAVCLANAKDIKSGLLDLNKYEYNADYSGLFRKGDEEGESVKYAYVYYFNATFKPGINKIHHTYSYTMSESVGLMYEISYKLSPAARWANRQIDDFTLIVRADNTAKHFSIQKNGLKGASAQIIEGKGKIRTAPDKSELYEIVLRNGAVQFHADNFRPDPEHELEIASAESIYGWTGGRLAESYDRVSCSTLMIWGYDNESAHKTLTVDQAKRIARNAPYANRGHVFKDPFLKKYFESLYWYMPDPSYVDSQKDFTESDKEWLKWQPTEDTIKEFKK